MIIVLVAFNKSQVVHAFFSADAYSNGEGNSMVFSSPPPLVVAMDTKVITYDHRNSLPQLGMLVIDHPEASFTHESDNSSTLTLQDGGAEKLV